MRARVIATIFFTIIIVSLLSIWLFYDDLEKFADSPDGMEETSPVVESEISAKTSETDKEENEENATVITETDEEIKITETRPVKGEPQQDIFLDERYWASTERLATPDGSYVSGVGFELDGEIVEVRAPADGYVFDYWIGDDENPNRIRMVVFTNRKDWSITLDEEKENIFSFTLGASSWVQKSINYGPVKKGMLIGTAVISTPLLKGLFKKDFNFIINPCAWWNNSRDGLPEDAAGYMSLLLSEFATE